MRSDAFRAPLLAVTLASALGSASALHAQREGYTYLSYVGPDVTLVSPADEDSAARLNTPILSGDVLLTGNASRAEAILADGNVVRVDGRTELRFERMNHTYEADDDRTVLSLARGTAAVEIRWVSTREQAPRLDTDDATIVSPARSVFRVDAGRRGTEVYVLAGKVEVSGRGGRALVRAGESAFVSGDAEIDVEAASPPGDRFTQFLEERRGRADRRDVTRYVGSDYSYDSDAAGFDEYGSWSYVSTAGAWGWRPEVAPGWTPYSLGTWRWAPCGLTWVSYEPWGWLPYHYGTWIADDALGWIWIPGDLYSPAWVTWSYGSDWTGWCPAGWTGGTWWGGYPRSSRITRGNERGGAWNPSVRGPVQVTQIDPRGWNFVPTSRLGRRLDPGRDVVRGDRVPFPRGETLVVTSSPLRVERGGSPAQAVQDAIRRGGRDAGPRVATTESPRPAGRAEAWRESPVRTTSRAGAPLVRDATRSRPDDGWRAAAAPTPAPVPRRERERREAAGDSGWRAPSPRVIERTTERPVFKKDDTPARRDAPPVVREAPRHEPVRFAPAPVVAAPARPPAPPPAPPPAAAPAPAAPRRDR